MGHYILHWRSDYRYRRSHGRQRAKRVPDHADFQHSHVVGLRPARPARFGRPPDTAMVGSRIVRDRPDPWHAGSIPLSLVADPASGLYHPSVVRNFFLEHALWSGGYGSPGAALQETEYAHRCRP